MMLSHIFSFVKGLLFIKVKHFKQARLPVLAEYHYSYRIELRRVITQSNKTENNKNMIMITTSLQTHTHP